MTRSNRMAVRRMPMLRAALLCCALSAVMRVGGDPHATPSSKLLSALSNVVDANNVPKAGKGGLTSDDADRIPVLSTGAVDEAKVRVCEMAGAVPNTFVPKMRSDNTVDVGRSADALLAALPTESGNRVVRLQPDAKNVVVDKEYMEDCVNLWIVVTSLPQSGDYACIASEVSMETALKALTHMVPTRDDETVDTTAATLPSGAFEALPMTNGKLDTAAMETCGTFITFGTGVGAEAADGTDSHATGTTQHAAGADMQEFADMDGPVTAKQLMTKLLQVIPTSADGSLDTADLRLPTNAASVIPLVDGKLDVATLQKCATLAAFVMNAFEPDIGGSRKMMNTDVVVKPDGTPDYDAMARRFAQIVPKNANGQVVAGMYTGLPTTADGAFDVAAAANQFRAVVPTLFDGTYDASGASRSRAGGDGGWSGFSTGKKIGILGSVALGAVLLVVAGVFVAQKTVLKRRHPPKSLLGE